MLFIRDTIQIQKQIEGKKMEIYTWYMVYIYVIETIIKWN